MRAIVGEEGGQAATEFVALLPLLAIVVALLWQIVLAGHAIWSVGAAARAAARASAVSADPLAAARAELPRSLRRGTQVRELDDGEVRVVVRLPSLAATLGTVSAEARFEPQS